MLEGITAYVHGGPGGNSLIEQDQLSSFDNVIFWQEPDNCPNFTASVDSLAHFIKINKVENLICHSFGSTTAAHALVNHNLQYSIKRLILLAPAFKIVECDLAILSALKKGNEELEQLFKIIKQERLVWSPNVLKALQLVSANPHYAALYWDNLNILQQFATEYFTKKAPLNIANYIAIRGSYKEQLAEIKTPTTVYLYNRDLVAVPHDQLPKVKEIFTNLNIIHLDYKHFGHIEHNFSTLYKNFHS